MNITDCSLIGAALGIVGVLIGIILGSRLAIGRDRRLEFNALIEPVHDSIYRGEIITDLTVLKIRGRLNYWQREGFDRAVKSYKQCGEACQSNRKFYITLDTLDEATTEKITHDEEEIKSAADTLLGYLKRR